MVKKRFLRLILIGYILFLTFSYIYIHGIQPLPDWMINYNLIPFHQTYEYATLLSKHLINLDIVIVHFIGNLFLLAPVGILLPLINDKEKTISKYILILFFISLFIECSEFFTRLGSFDIDDIILNTTGGILGLLVCIKFKLSIKSNH